MSDMKTLLENWQKFELEELFEKVYMAEELDENTLGKLKKGLAGLAIGASMLGGNPAMASTPAPDAPVAADVVKSTQGDRNTQVVNAWGGYIMKRDRENLKNLLSVLKKFEVPKDKAMSIVQANDKAEVLKILNSL